MNFNIFRNTMKALGVATLAVAALALNSCKEDDFTSRGDLFQPRFAAKPVITNHNDVAIVWYESNDAVSYTVQFFHDQYYQNLFQEWEIKDPFITVEDLPYGSRFYARVRCNASKAEHNSQWAQTDFTTEDRPEYAQLLQGVSHSEISDNGAVIRWTVDPLNPVDSISVKPAMSTTLPEITAYLTPEQKEAGELVLTDELTPSTLYNVNIYDTTKPRKYDKPYNQVTFRTTGPAPQTIEVSVTDDLSGMLSLNNEDPEIPDGTVYELPEGSTYTISPFAMSKGFKIVGPEEGTKPVLILNGTWNFASGAYISTFAMENVEVRNQAINQYFFNSGNSWTLESGSFINVKFYNINRAFWRHQGANNKHIIEFTLDGCWFDHCGYQAGCYATFDFASAGKGNIGAYDQIDALTIRDCTFSRGGTLQDASYGWRMLVSHANCYVPINLIVENITLYEFFNNATLIDVSATEKSTVTVRNILVASPISTLFVPGSGTVRNFSNNFATTDCRSGLNQISATQLPQSAADLFEDPVNGNYTIKDYSSPAYIMGAGDRRWLE
ncbi:MAG: DUF5123 domain-containing protein [[Clostridium] fimetarium]|nr:DUF5123 domain-containing protein [Alistipes timonensis]MCM1405754.1 DUF5123 domain-containing protein [[Clostridium] fimetarium]